MQIGRVYRHELSPGLIICIYSVSVSVRVKDSSLDRSGTQQDSSVVPVMNIKDPRDHLNSGGLVSVLSQHAA